MPNNTRYIFTVGGVMSGVGKGIATSSMALLLKARGFRVSAIKIDPYINVDAGTMNPTEHGEVFVTDDGMETDQDVGNYERFLHQDILSSNYMTTGSVYLSLIQKERNLEFDGKFVSVVPYVPLEVIGRIKRAAELTKSEFVFIEIGGTAGEYENLLFLEAARIMRLESPGKVMIVLVSYLPIPAKIGEMKTKPTQHAARSLNEAGLQADFIVARAAKPLDEVRKQKISLFCNVPKNHVISAPDIESIYEVPLNFEKEGLSDLILQDFGLKPKEKDLTEWKELVQTIKAVSKTVRIGIVGKYFQTGEFVLIDSYISVIEAIKHAAWANGAKPEIHWLDSEDYEKDPSRLKELSNYNGIIVPGGFGSRGVEGKILAIQYAREHKIPYLGLCYGMQLATIEFSRNVCGLKNAHTTEVNPKTLHPVITPMEEQKRLLKEKHYGGSMRLGAYDCELSQGTISYSAYSNQLSASMSRKLDADSGKLRVSERHRHRYEFNNKYREKLTKCGLVIAGINPQRDLVEIIELKNHPFFVGVQFHPEFKSRPLSPHPLYVKFIEAGITKTNRSR
ncbi:MAG: CTP synthase [Candidatus Portnoybacteria bacterium]|nr:CTP synthase [Candidatus Portnoybacteria bacterium]